MNKLKKNIYNYIYRRRFEKYVKKLNFDLDHSRQTILAINHFYDQDYRALMRANKEFNFIIIDGPAFARGAKLYFSSEVMHLNAPYDSENAADRAAWHDECKYMFDLLMRKFNFDVVITPSDVFWWIREFVSVAHDHGIKVVVLDKEGLISPYDFEAEAHRIRTMAPFISDHLLVWSERQRTYWNKIGVADDKITAIGQVRSDLFHHETNYTVDALFDKPQKLVTLFSYEDTAYIPPPLAKDGMSWQMMKLQTHDYINALAVENPDFNFVIKAHPQQSDLKVLEEKYRRNNLRVIGGAEVANELIQRSEFIIAFQTTAVIEAMFMNKHVIYTCWDDNYERLRDVILPFHNAPGIVVAEHFDSFKKTCRDFFAGDMKGFEFEDDTTASRNDFVNTYLYKPDGKVCERFFIEINKFMK